MWRKLQPILYELGVNSDAVPALMVALTEGLDQWRNLEDDPESEEMDDNIAEAFAKQTRIGWNEVALGFLSSKWQKVQQLHLEQKKSQRSSYWFVAVLIKKMWDVSLDVATQKQVNQTRTSKTSISAHVCCFFCCTLTTVLSSPSCQQVVWLEGMTMSALWFHGRLQSFEPDKNIDLQLIVNLVKDRLLYKKRPASANTNFWTTEG
eukprot:4737801-Ditylum_brightwellii.AAC.1